MNMQSLIDARIKGTLLSMLPVCGEIYLVGGAVRDYLNGSSTKDLDLVIKHNAIVAARNLADRLQGDFYVLDHKRETARALLSLAGEKYQIDFATMAGNDILDDLSLRDFTVNAIAVKLGEELSLLDPLGGEQDLQRKILRPCNPESFQQDAVRCIRAVRFILQLNLSYSESTAASIRKVVPSLREISAERKRDELFHIFEGEEIGRGLELINTFGMMQTLFPGVQDLAKVPAQASRVMNRFEHTQKVVSLNHFFLGFIDGKVNEIKEKRRESACELIDRYRQGLVGFLGKPPHAQRSYTGLVSLAGLYHDIGKTQIPATVMKGRASFAGHEEASRRIFHELSPMWALSNNEVRFIERMIANHMLDAAIGASVAGISRQALHRFYRDAGTAGVLLGIFHLADILATYGEILTDERWIRALQACEAILHAWFEEYDEIVEPHAWLSGDEIMAELQLEPGKLIGQLFGYLKEAQAGGLVTSREQALDFLKEKLGKAGIRDE